MHEVIMIIKGHLCRAGRIYVIINEKIVLLYTDERARTIIYIYAKSKIRTYLYALTIFSTVF